MKKKILFMLQNGIGFGHFKLALNISKYLDADYEIIFLTQAKSTNIFEGFNYKVYNFPLLYTLNSNNQTLLFSKLLNKLVERINPSIVIEDTYPEERYLNLPSLINTPKILLINRLVSSEFEEYYFSGVVNQYNKLIVLRNKEKFIDELTSLEVRNYAKFSPKVKYHENIFNVPATNIKREIRKKYKIDNYENSILVNCGAGGWHIGENICKAIFEETIKAANKVVEEGRNALMVIVLGPYSDYLKKDLKKLIKYPDNVKLISFEPNLDALLHIVDLAILRPGYNSTMEAISGKANILLLPGISYMEKQDQWCQELSREYGVDYLNVRDIKKIYGSLDKLLERNIRKRGKIQPSTENVALEIKDTIEVKHKKLPVNLAFNISLLKDKTTIKKVEKYIKDKNISLIDHTNCLRQKDYNIDIINLDDNYDCTNTDIGVIYNDEDLKYKRKAFYEQRYILEKRGVVLLEYNEIKLIEKNALRRKLLNILTFYEKYSDKVVVNLENGSYNFIKDNILDLLDEMLTNQEINIIGLEAQLGEIVNGRTSDYKWSYYKPEISKLK